MYSTKVNTNYNFFYLYVVIVENMGDLINSISKDIQKHYQNIGNFKRGLMKDVDNVNSDLINSIGLTKAQQELNDNFKKLIEDIQKPFALILAKPGPYNPFKD